MFAVATVWFIYTPNSSLLYFLPPRRVIFARVIFFQHEKIPSGAEKEDMRARTCAYQKWKNIYEQKHLRIRETCVSSLLERIRELRM